jgi:hypothetical protein
MEIDGGHVVPGIMDEQPRREQTQQRGRSGELSILPLA